MIEQDKIAAITAERGERYGDPRKHFVCTNDLASRWAARHEEAMNAKGTSLEHDHGAALHHCIYFIMDKLTRSAEDPYHVDNWDDIEGYVRCLKLCLFGEKK
jgi:hypothetical protein